jgi:hypothetical protein
MIRKIRICKCGCGASIEHKHPNARFLNKKHKDKFHNWNNPRGKFAHLADIDTDEEDERAGVNNDDYDPSDDMYWNGKDY